MMIGERDAIYLAKLPKSVGLVSRIAPSHSGARAELGKSEAPRDPFEFVGHETVVEADIMGDENAVPHKLHESVRYLREQGCVPNHFVRDAGQLNDLCRNGTLRIDERMPLVDDTVIANLHRADLGDAIAIRPGAGRLDIDHHVVLLGVETIIHPTDLGDDAGCAELAEAGQLVAADHVPLR